MCSSKRMRPSGVSVCFRKRQNHKRKQRKIRKKRTHAAFFPQHQIVFCPPSFETGLCYSCSCFLLWVGGVCFKICAGRLLRHAGQRTILCCNSQAFQVARVEAMLRGVVVVQELSWTALVLKEAREAGRLFAWVGSTPTWRPVDRYSSFDARVWTNVHAATFFFFFLFWFV